MDNRDISKAKYRQDNNGLTCWTTLPFGKHSGKTLPQVICHGTSWFLWAVRNSIFYPDLEREAEILHRRLRGIIVPKAPPEEWIVEYRYEDDGRFLGFDIVKKGSYRRSKHNYQANYLSVDFVRPRYRGEWRKFTRDLRWYFFAGRNLTKDSCERFFSDKSRFLHP